MADPNPEATVKRVKRLIPTADQWRDSAEKVIFWAGCSLKDPGANIFNDRAYNLVDRCFMIHQHGDNHLKIEHDLKNIKVVFRKIAKFYADVKATGNYLRCLEIENTTDVANADVGGYDRGDKDGITYVFDKCKSRSETKLIDVTNHESAHFAGNIGHFDINGAAAYGQDALRLTNPQALVNASNYAWLAYLARLPSSQWLSAN